MKCPERPEHGEAPGARRSTRNAVKRPEYLEPADHAECVECPEPPGVLRSTRESRASLGVLCARGVRGASWRVGSPVKGLVRVEYRECCKAPGVLRNARSAMKCAERPKHPEYAERRRARGAPGSALEHGLTLCVRSARSVRSVWSAAECAEFLEYSVRL